MVRMAPRMARESGSGCVETGICVKSERLSVLILAVLFFREIYVAPKENDRAAGERVRTGVVNNELNEEVDQDHTQWSYQVEVQARKRAAPKNRPSDFWRSGSDDQVPVLWD